MTTVVAPPGPPTLRPSSREQKLAERLTVISLFSGGGGLDLGFERAGCDVVECVDNDPESCKTLRFNRPDWNVFEGDIREYHPPEDGADLVIGGPPCQGFSMAGKGNPSDPRNFLWQEYFRIVKAARPAALVVENVSGLKHQRNGDHLSGIIEALEEYGYKFAVGVLNAADFGVPQTRRRLFVIGMRDRQSTLPAPAVSEYQTVRDAIEDLVSTEDADFNHKPNRHAPHVVKRWSKLKPGEEDPGYRRSRLDFDKPSHTIRAGGGYGPRGDHLAGFHPPIHPSLPRQLTVREAARIQSFPDDWIFQGSKTAQGRQVGNAVPVRMAEAVAKHVVSLLKKK
jgi:DNA (cytosine-5)-methyltransferase 1